MPALQIAVCTVVCTVSEQGYKRLAKIFTALHILNPFKQVKRTIAIEIFIKVLVRQYIPPCNYSDRKLFIEIL